MTDALLSRPFKIFFGIIAVFLLIHAFFPAQPKPLDPMDLVSGECEGEPIMVPYAYTGNVVDPWSCQPQCDDKKQHYLVYTNGIGTQCEPLPGCNDQGEDNGVTCKLPANAPTPVVSTNSTSMKSQGSSQK